MFVCSYIFLSMVKTYGPKIGPLKKKLPYGTPIRLYGRKKERYWEFKKNEAKIRLKYFDETLILRRNFFPKSFKSFLIDLMIMFKVYRRCLQRFSLRWKKNYERTIILENIFNES